MIDKKNYFILYIKVLKKIFNFLIYVIGFLFFILFVIILYFYISSNIYISHSPKQIFLKFNDIILDRYLGFNFFNTKEYFTIYKDRLFFSFKENKIDQAKLNLSQQSIMFLEKQRNARRENEGELNDDLDFSVKGKLIVNNKEYNVSLKTKGVRPLHWANKNETSYKIYNESKNKDEVIMFDGGNGVGLKNFSFQKPITKNYVHEYIFHSMLHHAGNISLKYFLINLEINGNKNGIYVVEENFSKQAIERNKRKDGPIFSLNEIKGEIYPNISFEVYGKKNWLKNNPDFLKAGFSILNSFRDDKLDINTYFDIDAWAKYFAIIDLTGTYHGSLSKSVRFYYNPVTTKIEPIGYDGHYGAGDFKDFIILDFLKNKDINCIYLCPEKKWFNKFLIKSSGELNDKFIDLYINYLKEFSSDKFLNNFNNIYLDEINKFNLIVNSEDSRSDKIIYKGLGLNVYDKNFLEKRAALIKKRLSSNNPNTFSFSLDGDFLNIENNISEVPIKILALDCNLENNKSFYILTNGRIKWSKDCQKILISNSSEKKVIKIASDPSFSKNYFPDDPSKFEFFHNNFLTDFSYPNIFTIKNKKIEIAKNYYIPENTKIIIEEGTEIIFLGKYTIYSDGELELKGSLNNPINIKSNILGNGSIVVRDNVFDANNVIVTGLGSPILLGHNLSGSINTINSQVKIKNFIIQKSQSEDAINLISSNSYLENVKLMNNSSDALDIDFGSINFKNIKCYKNKNDCFDSSGSEIKGFYIDAQFSGDKGLSLGENSYGEISDIKSTNNKTGVAVKDGSKILLKNIDVQNNQYDIAVFKKKATYHVPELIIDSPNFYINDKRKILVGQKDSLVINNQNIKSHFSDKEIYNLFY